MNELKVGGIYIHLPFCRSKCYYCDFNSFPQKDSIIPAYIDALLKEIDSYGRKIEKYLIDTIFIGGGTPSYIDERYIIQLLEACYQNFNVDSHAEITIESNPGTLCAGKLKAYKTSGINRLSIGLQAWQDRLLKKIGRAHSLKDYIDNFNLAREVGFNNINTDLIFAIPCQSLQEWCETLENISLMNPEHISCYSLQIEEGTVFGDMFSKGILTPLTDEEDREMYYMAKEILGDAGYKHYEISNFAKPAFECKHNLTYWQYRPYIGIGAGAHSYFDGKRYNNVNSPEYYIDLIQKGKQATENLISIGMKEAMSEYMFLGLRLIEGVRPKDFKGKFGIDLWSVFGLQLNNLLKRQLIFIDTNIEDSIRLTSKGLDLANQVFMEFI